jgi:SOS-response transcriptional repressor LexA
MPYTRDEIIWANVQRVATKKGWTNALLAERTGTTPQHINAIKHGRRGVGKHLLKRFAQALDVSEAELLVETTEFTQRQTVPIPVFSPEETDLIIKYISSDTEVGKERKISFATSRGVSKRAFGVMVADESMAPRFLPGDVAVVDPDVLEDDERGTYLVAIGEAVYLRRIQGEKMGDVQEIRLMASNPAFPDIIVKILTTLKILGKVVDLCVSI